MHPIVYDATAILGFGQPSEEPLPEAKIGEVVIRYGSWSLQNLRDSEVGRRLMHQEDWYDKYDWSREKLPAGAYRLHIPVQRSKERTYADQTRLLGKDRTAAPVVLVATALLAHRINTLGKDLLNGDWSRCRERTAAGGRVGLGWYVGRLIVSIWDDGRNADLWLSSARKC